MRIDTVQHLLPSRRIDEDWILSKLEARNARSLGDSGVGEMRSRVSAFLEAAGSDVKYQIGEGDRALQIMASVSRKALAESGCDPGDVDLLLYTGVGRAWLEPAMVNVLQSELGLRRATGFDLLDGCAGWLRALELVHSYFRTGRYRRALVVNAELAFEDFGRWDFSSLQDLESYLATYTIGEAATATVLSASGDTATVDDQATDRGDYYFRFANYGEHADLCMIPLSNADQFLPDSARERFASLEPGRFYARSEELLTVTMKRLIETYRADPELCGRDYDIGFGHAASEKASAIVCRGLGFPPERYFPTHARFGNTVSASIPLGISVALEEGKLQRGHRVLVVAGASGISIGLARFVF